MALPLRSAFDCTASLRADGNGAWTGTAEQIDTESLVGARPTVSLAKGRLALSAPRLFRWIAPAASSARMNVGPAVEAAIRDGDVLSWRRDAMDRTGVSLLRAGRLVLLLGETASTGPTRISTEHDPRVDDAKLARTVRYVTNPGTVVFWLDPERPDDLETRIRAFHTAGSGVHFRAIVARTDDERVRLELNRRTMQQRQFGGGGAVFISVSSKFPSLDAWLAHGRSLSPERRSDFWVLVTIDGANQRIPQGATTTLDGWLVHLHGVYEPGLNDRAPFLAIVRSDAGVTAALLEASAAAAARGVFIERAAT